MWRVIVLSITGDVIEEVKSNKESERWIQTLSSSVLWRVVINVPNVMFVAVPAPGTKTAGTYLLIKGDT